MTEPLTILEGDALAVLQTLPDETFHCVISSPPYWGLRDYGIDGQYGLEPTPEAYLARMVEVFREVRRVLRSDGTCWVNMGGGYQDKEVDGMPWRLAFALQAERWWLRQDIVWAKPAPMPESCTDRCTKSHEYIFLFAKSARYFYDATAIAEPCKSESWHDSDFRRERNFLVHPTTGAGERNARTTIRNRRDVWTIASEPDTDHFCASCATLYSRSEHAGLRSEKQSDGTLRVWCRCGQAESWFAHFARFPAELPKLCILAGTSARGCCPKCGAPWERVVENSPEYQDFVDSERERKGGRLMRDGLDGAPGITRGTGKKSISAQRTTTGWRPTCECGPVGQEAYGEGVERCGASFVWKPVPCRVLDPFAGSGTVSLAARELGRHATLIELNPDYAALARCRCNVTPGLQLA
jgi:DNA modification methylase